MQYSRRPADDLRPSASTDVSKWSPTCVDRGKLEHRQTSLSRQGRRIHDIGLGLLQEFNHVKQWAQDNKMVINLLKTKEIVFRRPNPMLHITPLPIPGVQQVSIVLGVTLCDTLSFTVHVENMLKICSQRLQGGPKDRTVF